MDAENLGILLLELVAVCGLIEGIRFTWRKRRPPASEERWNVRYERMGNDPVDTQWKHRENEMNQRQARLDASQDVMTRLI